MSEPATGPITTAHTALDTLLLGNARYLSGSPAHPNQDAHRRTELASGQKPFALIFGCSDSRVAAEIIFDRGLGDLFMVRTAGHVVDDGVLGSIEFGVEVLEVPLIVVLGHDSCGAVKATADAYSSGEMPGGYLRKIVELVTPSLISARRRGIEEIDEIVAEHAVQTAHLLVERSPALAKRVANGTLAVVPMAYRLADGEVRVLEAPALA
ncbi:carbonic anhydrase [Spongisporangium articulatum]|uniref:carbonic anhydrase n=1 Tax=Spongisporangium articulatum TaxID=3362603 RepID=A0ABW8AQD9_9ACTN